MTSTKKTKKKTTKTSAAEARIEKYYNKIVIGFIAATVLLLAVIMYFSFAKTVVVLHPNVTTEQLSQNLSTEDVFGMVLLTDVSASESFSGVSSSESRPGRASGTVTIVNNYSADQPLVETTRLLSEDGVLFRTQETVTVPAGGSVEVSVAADEEGEAGNIGPSRFEVVALWDGLKEQIYAESSTAMTGGLITESLVTASDIEKVHADTDAVLEEEAMNRFSQELNTRTELPEQPLLADTVSIVEYAEKSIDASEGDSVEQVTATHTATVAGVIVDRDALVSRLQQSAQENTLEGEAVLASPDITDIQVTVNSVNDERTAADVTVTYSVQTSIDESSELLDTTRLTGLTERQIDEYFAVFEEVESVDVHFSPFWLQKTPSLPENIHIRIDK